MASIAFCRFTRGYIIYPSSAETPCVILSFLAIFPVKQSPSESSSEASFSNLDLMNKLLGLQDSGSSLYFTSTQLISYAYCMLLSTYLESVSSSFLSRGDILNVTSGNLLQLATLCCSLVCL